MSDLTRTATAQTTHPSQSPLPSGLLQRQCACGQHTTGGGECAACRQKRQGALQRSPSGLAINRPGDRFEQEAERVAVAVISGGELPGRTLSSGPALRRDGPPPAPSPRDPSADERRKYPGASLPDLGFNEPKNDQHVQQPSETLETNADRFGKAGEGLLDPWSATKLGKEVSDQIERFGAPFVATLGSTVVSISAAISTVAAIFTPMYIRNEEIPIQPPAIKIAPGLKVRLTYKGPAQAPTDASITFIYEPQEAKKPQASDTERTRADTERMAADQAKFQKGAKTPAERAAEQRQLDAIVRGRQAQSGNILGIPGLTPRRDDRMLQRDANGSSDLAVAPPIVHDVLSSPGQPLDPATRSFMEPRFGHDFSGVRVHTDGRAADSARDVSANAYTVGHNVVFGAGRFAPETHEGRRLIAHELTHVVQQSDEPLQAMLQRKEENNADLAAIQGLSMYQLLTQLSTKSKNILDDEEAGRFVGGSRLVVAMRAVRARIEKNSVDFLANNSRDLEALPPDQIADIRSFLGIPANATPTPTKTPPFFGLSNAPDAFHGIVLGYKVKTLPHADGTLQSHWISRRPYSIKLYHLRNLDGSVSIEYFNVVRTEPGLLGSTHWTEYYVGPDSIVNFLSNVDGYAAGGAAGYMFGPPGPNAIESVRFVDAVMAGEGDEAINAYKAALYESVKDPGWWVQMLTAGAGLFRGPAAVPRAPTPGAPIVPKAPIAPPVLRIYSGGGGKPSAVVGRVSGGVYASEGGAALQARPAPVVSPATAPAPVRLAPAPVAVPEPLVVAPPGSPFIPLAVAATVKAAIVAGALKPQASQSAADDVKKKRRYPDAYPLYWPSLFGPPMLFGIPVTLFIKGPNQERDQDYALEVRRELWARHRGKDPDLFPKELHAHHIVPLFLGGLEGTRGNITFLPGPQHLRGHGQLNVQPQMTIPPPPLKPLSENILRADHVVGTKYELVDFK